MLNILHTVESYYPSIGGMQEVVKQLSERLVKNGHNVTVATSFHKERMEEIINGVKVKTFQLGGNFTNGFKGTEQEQKAYQDYLLNQNFDIIVNFAAQQWATDLTLLIIEKIKAKKIIVPTGFSGFYLKQYQPYFSKMKNWLKQYDKLIFLSNDYRDINFAREIEIAENKIQLIPNGASEEEFYGKSTVDIRENLDVDENDFLILHLGSYTGMKGHKEALELFVKSKIKNAVLVMVGNNNHQFKTLLWRSPKLLWLNLLRWLKQKKVLITSLNRDQTIAALQQANLFIFPSNIECSPIVLFESMASQTPFLSADVGNAKEIVSWSNGGQILPTNKTATERSEIRIQESVDELNKLANDKLKLERLGKNGRTAWEEKFTWSIIANQYEAVYKKVLEL